MGRLFRYLLPLAVVPAAYFGLRGTSHHSAVSAAPRHEPPPPELARVATAALGIAAWTSGQVPLPPALDPFGEEAATTGLQVLRRNPHGFRDDCSGYISEVFTELGVPMDGVVATLWDLAVDHDTLHWRERPDVGDLAFFDNTWDRNRNGRWDDEFTHIALVVDVEPDGTVLLAHSGTSAGRSLTRMNLLHPSSTADEDGARLNDYLREPAPGDPPTSGYLTGELWVAFATVDPALDWLTPAPVE